jgi:hypothetical protein
MLSNRRGASSCAYRLIGGDGDMHCERAKPERLKGSAAHLYADRREAFFWRWWLSDKTSPSDWIGWFSIMGFV